MRLSRQMIRILLALRELGREARLFDIIIRCEGLPEYYFHIPTAYDEVWVAKCRNLQTAFASREPEFDGVNLPSYWDRTVLGFDLITPIRKLYSSYHRSARTLLKLGLIERVWEPRRKTWSKRYFLSQKGLEVLSVKWRMAQLPQQQKTNLKPSCPECLWVVGSVVYLSSQHDEPAGWTCPNCSFRLLLTNSAGLSEDIFESFKTSL